MSQVYLEEALRLTGKSRAKLYKMMKTGSLSFSTNVDGRRLLETSELMRVFGALLPSNTVSENADSKSHTAVDEDGLALLRVAEAELVRAQAEIQEKTRRLAELEQETQDKDREIGQLNQNLDDLRTALRLLEHRPVPQQSVQAEPLPAERGNADAASPATIMPTDSQPEIAAPVVEPAVPEPAKRKRWWQFG